MDDDHLEIDDEHYEGEGGEGGPMYKEIEIREQDRYLPIANIARIMKKVLPGNAKIAKESKESIQECVSEFISFITSEASDKCQQEKRKTINGDDLLWAMSTLGFDKYVDPLRIYLTKYRDSVKGERPEKKTASRKEMTASAQPKSMGMRQASYGFEDMPPGMGFLPEPANAMLAPGKGGELPSLPMMRQPMASLPPQPMYSSHTIPPSLQLSHPPHSQQQTHSSQHSHQQIPSIYSSSSMPPHVHHGHPSSASSSNHPGTNYPTNSSHIQKDR